jgi:hypothetical protein
MLLDLNDPLKVIGCLDEPLIAPTEKGEKRGQNYFWHAAGPERPAEGDRLSRRAAHRAH